MGACPLLRSSTLPGLLHPQGKARLPGLQMSLLCHLTQALSSLSTAPSHTAPPDLSFTDDRPYGQGEPSQKLLCQRQGGQRQ